MCIQVYLPISLGRLLPNNVSETSGFHLGALTIHCLSCTLSSFEGDQQYLGYGKC